MLIEDICAHLTIATGRPVKLEYTREEQFVASTSRHPMIVRMRTGVMADGRMVANEMRVLSDTGAYGNHALTVTGNTGHKCMSLYPANRGADGESHIRFVADVVYTNKPTSGAYRGYGVPQGFFPLESHMEHIARTPRSGPVGVPPDERGAGRRRTPHVEGVERRPRGAPGTDPHQRDHGMRARRRGDGGVG